MAGPHAMDWPTYAGARAYLAEQRVGTLIRQAERAEDEEFKAAARAASGV